MSKLKMPDFETEAEEATWWFENQDAIADDYFDDNASELLSLFFSEEDVQLVLTRAGAQGTNPSQYVRELMHHALHESQAA